MNTSTMQMRRLAGAGVAGAVAVLLAVGFLLICSDARVSAQPVVLAPSDTVTYTSQIRWPEKDAIITQTEPLIVSGIAWTSDVEPPYLVDDPHLTTQKVDNYNYYVGWTDVVSAENYILQEATQPDFSDQTSTILGPSTTNQLITKGAGEAGTYYYRVQATKFGLASSRWSNVESVVVPWTGALASLPEMVANGTITVQVALDDGPWYTATVTPTGWGGWDWTYEWPLPEEIDVQHAIKSRSGGSDGTFGPTDVVTVTLSNGEFMYYLPVSASRWPPIPHHPALDAIVATDRDGDYAVSWSYTHTAPSVLTYTLEEDDDPAFASPATVYSGGDLTHNVTDQAQGMSYYRVRGENEWGLGGWSNIESVQIIRYPYSPTLQSIDNADKDGNYTVNWSYGHADAPVDTYTLEEDDNQSFSSPTTVYSGGGTSHAVTGQANGTYYYRAQGENTWGPGEWSNVVSATVDAFSYFDDFSDYQSGWPREWSKTRGALYQVRPYEHPQCPGSDCDYDEGDGYVIARRSGSNPKARFTPGVAVPSANYEIQVDARWFDAAYYATYQIFFGSDLGMSNYYAVQVRINDTGGSAACEYSLIRHTVSLQSIGYGRVVSIEGTKDLQGWRYTSAVHCGVGSTTWNRWKIRREGNEIKIWVRGNYLGTWTDSAFGANRYFGVGCTLYEGFTPSKPEFDNWSVELIP